MNEQEIENAVFKAFPNAILKCKLHGYQPHVFTDMPFDEFYFRAIRHYTGHWKISLRLSDSLYIVNDIAYIKDLEEQLFEAREKFLNRAIAVMKVIQ